MVEIRQHVETTPMVSKEYQIGTILINKYDRNSDGKNITGWTVIGKHRVFNFIGNEYVSVSDIKSYTASSILEVAEKVSTISYLREKSQKILGSVVSEIEEGVFDD